ncbi:MAG TPA: SigE family RNA polymerase sigma factor [Nocardioides sp.]|nr:SigE family RNA polymerase sigma factor [Nocardioides sp.]
MDAELAEYVGARWPRLVRAAVLLGCTPTEAEDVVQGVLERCVRKWSQVRRADDRDAYVHRMLVNAFVSSRRRRWRNELPVAAVPARADADATAEVDDADVMARALDRLSTDHRTVVVLRYYAQLSEQQMAAVLQIAPGTVKSRLSRALRDLADDPQLDDLRGIQ